MDSKCINMFRSNETNKASLKAVYDDMLSILMSSLFNSVLTFEKKEFLKYSLLLLKDGTFVLFLVL